MSVLVAPGKFKNSTFFNFDNLQLFTLLSMESPMIIIIFFNHRWIFSMEGHHNQICH